MKRKIPNGILPDHAWFKSNALSGLSCSIRKHPEKFSHIPVDIGKGDQITLSQQEIEELNLVSCGEVRKIPELVSIDRIESNGLIESIGIGRVSNGTSKFFKREDVEKLKTEFENSNNKIRELISEKELTRRYSIQNLQRHRLSGKIKPDFTIDDFNGKRTKYFYSQNTFDKYLEEELGITLENEKIEKENLIPIKEVRKMKGFSNIDKLIKEGKIQHSGIGFTDHNKKPSVFLSMANLDKYREKMPNHSSFRKEWATYKEFKKFINDIGVSSAKEWFEWCRYNNRPNNIPSNPVSIYKNKGWDGWSSLFGNKKIKYQDAKKIVSQLEFKSPGEFQKWARSNKNIFLIPIHPDIAYKKEGFQWTDFLNCSFQPPKEFSNEEIDFIIDNYSKLSTQEISESLSRSKSSIQSRILHLRKSGKIGYKKL